MNKNMTVGDFFQKYNSACGNFKITRHTAEDAKYSSSTIYDATIVGTNTDKLRELYNQKIYNISLMPKMKKSDAYLKIELYPQIVIDLDEYKATENM